jgi:two-component system chemotaxis response regulator CheB
MRQKHKIKVLIVDDSLVFREVLKRAINADPGLEVVAEAVDPYDARDKILQYKPDVMTLDVQLPKMNGIEFLKQLLPQFPLPVVVISAVGDSVFMAMEVGAVDFIEKPTVNSEHEIQSFTRNVQLKIKIASMAKVHSVDAVGNKRVAQAPRGTSRFEVIAVGASTGGTEAFYTVLEALPSNMPPIVVVQHMPPVFTKLYADRLHNSCALNVYEAEDGMVLRRGCVYIAPGDYHMKIVRGGDGKKIRLYDGEKVNGHRPAVDILFHSVAEIYKSRAIGVLLTGMGYDGAKGLLEMKNKGAYTIGQDQESSVVYGMPMVAYNIGAVEEQAGINKIARILVKLLSD